MEEGRLMNGDPAVAGQSAIADGHVHCRPNPRIVLLRRGILKARAILRLLLIVTVWTQLASRASAADWADQRISGPFVCRSDFRLDEYDGLFVELGQLQTDLSQALGVEPAHESVELYLFQTEFSYRNYLQVRLPQVPYRRALFVKGRGPGKVFAYRSKELPVDVRHEGTHGLLHAALPMVPLWLDEGLAEYFEVSANKRQFANPHLKWTRLDLTMSHVTKLEVLEAKRDVSEMNGTDYRHAWAWTHFLIHGPPEAHDELVKFLADIQSSTPPGRLSERLERRLPGLDKRLAQHFKTWKK
jgi:Protein of unknown function (DUF1570)